MASTHGVELFLQKYQTAKNFNSKEIRLTIQEAEQLSIGISLLLAKESQLNAKIIELQEKLLNQNNTIEVSGGTFS